MKAVYYYDKQSNCCPVKKYLQSFLINKKDPIDIIERKTKLLIDLDNKIKKILDNECRPIPPIAKPLKQYGIIEITHRKDKNVVIRIIYSRCDDMMVLLLAFEKPDNYSSNKIKKEIDKQYKIAEFYKKLFILNKQLYENYN
jgi:hypothetical protein